MNHLTTGDETWTTPAITMFDGGTSVAPLHLLCGRTVNLQLALAGEVSDDDWNKALGAPDSHLEGATADFDNIPIECD